MLFALIGAAIIGLSLGLFGSGGSILTVPTLLYLLMLPPEIAIATSLAIVAGISVVGSVFNFNKKLISFKHVVFLGLPGMTATYFGAWFGASVSSVVQLSIFAVMMFIAAGVMWRGKKESEQTISQSKSILVVHGAIIGLITGFVGVGGGFLLVPALVWLAGLPLLIATATSLAIISLNAAVGFLKYAGEFGVTVFDWPLIVLMIFGGVIGSTLGLKLAAQLPKERMQKGFAVFLVLMACVVFFKSLV
ncbi:hypothetical protein PALB_35440 [Pseudoalteromonas luteoviolacea B = ATCC 29581]|nr:hypothetical protein PALB_35440 [Pseudoalteromonas luteoviolacea B = ATCC 29581]